MSLAIEVFRLRAWYQSHSKSIEAERQQMARHLHDTLAHDLAYLLLKLDQFSSYPSRVSSDTFLQEASRLRDIAQRAYEQVRNILSELQEKPAQSLCSGIQECIEAANHRAQLKIELSISGEEIAIPPHQARQILLVIREALRNIEKHANAKKGFVHLDWMENALMVEINDNGQGLELDRGRRGEDNYGLRFIQQAVEEWNGKFTISSSNTSGTRLNFYIPIEK
jgi:two-component system nitrate/nitrite sensor histidine kinase NarX